MSARVAQSRLSRGLAKPSLYKIEIPTSDKNGGFSKAANEYLEYFCKSVFVPGVSHDSFIINGHGRQGVVTSQPYSIKYNKPLTVTVIERSDYIGYQQFQRWFDKTANNTFSLTGAQRMRYRSEFTCPVLLTKLELPSYSVQRGSVSAQDFTGNEEEGGFRKALELKFENAYVTSISDIQLGSDMNGSMVEYQVEFTYDSYEVKLSDDTGNR